MKIMILILSLIFVLSAFSQESLTRVTLNTEVTPSEVELIFDHLKSQKLSSDQEIQTLMALKLLGEDLTGLKKANLIFFLKSEFYKVFLDNQFLPNADNLDVSQAYLTSTESKLKKNTLLYSSLAKFMIKNIISDLEEFKADNFLNNYKSVKRSDTNALIKAQKLKKKLKYLSPWLLAIDQMSVNKFNSMITQISIDYFHIISKKSYLFKQFRVKSKNTKTIIQDFDSNQMVTLIASLSKNSKSNSQEDSQPSQKENKKQAIKTLKEVENTPNSDPSKTIDDLVEKLKINSAKN